MDYLTLFKSVLEQESEAISQAKLKITNDQVQKILNLYKKIITNGGDLVVCGVGKSGAIANKIASTFSSLGLSSFFLHPTEALHGDLGRVDENDGIIWISKSGTTEEILKLMPFIKIPSENSIALVGNIQSEIALKCDIRLDCSVVKEASFNNLAPTTSSTLALAMGDALAVIFEAFIGVSKEKFALNHPGGLLGKSLSLKVSNLMLAKDQTPCLSVDDLLSDALLKMTKLPTGICCILDLNSNLLGILVEGDIRRALTTHKEALSLPIGQLMNKNPKVIQATDLAINALKLMESKDRLVSVLPVLNGKTLVGIIRLHDLLKEGFSLT